MACVDRPALERAHDMLVEATLSVAPSEQTASNSDGKLCSQGYRSPEKEKNGIRSLCSKI